MNAEIVVIGGGPAGTAAAVRARESSARVVVIDDNPAAGGQIWRGTKSPRFHSADIPMLLSTQVVSADGASRTLLVETSGQAQELHFEKLILATGARELFLPFPGWTLPGVMGVGGLQALAKSGLPLAGKKIVVAGSGPLLLAASAYFVKHGAQVKGIAEQASSRALWKFIASLAHHPEKLMQAAGLRLSLLGSRYLADCWIEAAEGNGRVQRVHLRRGKTKWAEDCDYAAVAYGLYPNTELASLLGCRVEGKGIAVDELQQSSLENIFCAGECTGIGGVDLAIIEGEIAGHAACGRIDHANGLFAKRQKARRFAEALNTAFTLRDELKMLPQPDTFVCRCEDVALQKLQTMNSFRAAKLHTRCGMGPCQGRVCSPAMEFLFGWKMESIRPPIFPACIGSLATEPFAPKEAVIT